MENTIAGIDLAKNVIQVCVHANKQVQFNKEMPANKFTEWLANSKPMTIVFEACGTSNYWKQTAISFGHDARLISAKLVSTIRQNQKTDKNDALAVVQAALLPGVTFIAGKSTEQQQLQSILRLRELCVKQKTASFNQLQALLLEFNIKVSGKKGGLGGVIQSTLEDAENGLSSEFREALSAAWLQYQSIIKSIGTYDKCLEKSMKEHADCQKLLKLEGVGPLNAVNLYIALGCAELGVFRSGRDAAACIGLTPLQHSSGGKTVIGTIGKYVKNSLLRSQLISGAMAAVRQIVKNKPKTKKEQWVFSVAERRGKKIAAVALANKTVRTAYALLTQNTEYTAVSIAA